MKYRTLGDSDLQVSEIGFGSWLTFSDSPRKQAAIACVHRALDRGINFLDTANVYGRGIAESVLGEALLGVRRDSYILATKLFFPMSPVDRGLSRSQVHKQLEASLKRLRVDYIDLYQCHRYDFHTPLAETMEALTEAVNSGKVRYIGFSGMAARPDRGGDRPAGCCALCIEPTSVLAAASRSGTRPAGLMREVRHLTGRVVTPRTRGPERKVPAGCAAARGQSCRGSRDGCVFESGLVRARDLACGAGGKGAGGPGVTVVAAAGTCVDPAATECRSGDYRRFAPRAD